MNWYDIIWLVGIPFFIVLLFIIGRVSINLGSGNRYRDEDVPLHIMNYILSLFISVLWPILLPILLVIVILIVIYFYMGKLVDYLQNKVQEVLKGFSKND